MHAVGVNCEVAKCFPAVASDFQMLPSPASYTEQINTVLIACKLSVVYVEKLGKQATLRELYTLISSSQIDSDSTSDYSDDDVVGRSRSEPETKPILSVREYYEYEVFIVHKFGSMDTMVSFFQTGPDTISS